MLKNKLGKNRNLQISSHMIMIMLIVRNLDQILKKF